MFLNFFNLLYFNILYGIIKKFVLPNYGVQLALIQSESHGCAPFMIWVLVLSLLCEVSVNLMVCFTFFSVWWNPPCKEKEQLTCVLNKQTETVHCCALSCMLSKQTMTLPVSMAAVIWTSEPIFADLKTGFCRSQNRILPTIKPFFADYRTVFADFADLKIGFCDAITGFAELRTGFCWPKNQFLPPQNRFLPTLKLLFAVPKTGVCRFKLLLDINMKLLPLNKAVSLLI